MEEAAVKKKMADEHLGGDIHGGQGEIGACLPGP